MNKKTFQNRPVRKPLQAADIDQFVENGPGRDQQAANPTLQEAVLPESQDDVKPAFVNFTVKIPSDLHRRYKASCSIRGMKMVDEIRSFIETRINQENV